MTLILQDPSTKKPYEINSGQVETPVQKNMKTKEVRLIYLFILVLILVIIAAIVFSTATMRKFFKKFLIRANFLIFGCRPRAAAQP